MRSTIKRYNLVIRATPQKHAFIRTVLLGLAGGFVYGKIRGISSFELREKKDVRHT